MDRNLARKNVRTAIVLTAICVLMFILSFVAASLYIAQ
jgi:hypothetical protein